eukprot:Protomagalhaensia_wolfi_Nauph_80__6118@NODE_87_length_3843_cov_136_166404_g66_i0_p2_GENE_NODE_87_length_3843_cov_136_166404_g66_i0NODE_87_length_3843_cov_136_166404_g66_i0_p2_ORF_typecomplete_len226_score13_80PIPLCX/PF00388_19/1_4e09Varsurf_PPLC/PF03490_13/0_0036_NODE_87_length_3843_cov_136_166404_g66_i08061483
MVLKYIGVGDTKIRFCSLCGCAGSVMDDSEAEASDVVIPLGDWMDRCLWPRVQDHWRVGDIVFPGSHNSGSALYRGVGPQWGACQKASVLQQLEMGVRFLDLRVADDVDSAKRLWICHTFRSCLLSNVLDDIQTFLKAHFREFIGIRIEKDAERTLSEQGEQLLNVHIYFILIACRTDWIQYHTSYGFNCRIQLDWIQYHMDPIGIHPPIPANCNSLSLLQKVSF